MSNREVIFDNILKKNQRHIRSAMSMIPIDEAHAALMADCGEYGKSLDQTLSDSHSTTEFFEWWVKLADSLSTEIDMMAIRNTSEEISEMDIP